MTTNNIRNFCIIAHIDHGKSTLSDRMLEITNTVDKRKMHDQFMDTLDLEQERGITIKLQTARMNYKYKNEDFILNLIDTPGHVDFSYEVSRSLMACEGALLLVDAAQGVEAQTIANALKALEHDLTIIPVVNKIDLPNAQPDERAEEICEIFGFKRDEIIFTSGKTGQGVEALLEEIVKKVPPPKGDNSKPLSGLIFDSFYDNHKGVVVQVRIFDGSVAQSDFKTKDKLKFIGTNIDIEPLEIGYLTPSLQRSDNLETGEVGYIATGRKDINSFRVGDTVTLSSNPCDPLPGYKKVTPMIFAGLFPTDTNKQTEFREALEKLALNDASLQYTPESSQALGFGFRCGFLGLLHMEIVQERLEREYNIDLIITAPSVEYQVKVNSKKWASHFVQKEDSQLPLKENILEIKSAAELPDMSYIDYILEPIVNVEIITPETYIGDIMEICTDKRGIYLNTDYISSGKTSNLKRVILRFEMPLAEVVSDFFDRIKSQTHGYASLDYVFKEFRQSDIVKIDFLVLGEKVDALSILTEKSKANRIGQNIVKKLKDVIPKQHFQIPIQAGIGGKIIARENISAIRKNVTQGLYGGDFRRKMKHLERQKEGKKRMKSFGKVEIPQEAFLTILKTSD